MGVTSLAAESIVTFTTLGLGDVIAANFFSRLLLTAEVMWGYVVLGGLIGVTAGRRLEVALKLRPKQQAFVEEYLVDLNGTQAAIRAGYSRRTAQQMASENLTKPVIIEALGVRRAELAEANDVTPERVMAEYALVGFADIADYMTWGNAGFVIKDPEELPEGATRAISEITETFSLSQGRTIKLKFHDKKGALDSLCRMMGWNAPEKQDIRMAVVTLADIARRRAEEARE